MSRQVKTNNKAKSEEIAALVEQQVQNVVDPFAATFNALWGESLESDSKMVNVYAPVNVHSLVNDSTPVNADTPTPPKVMNDHSLSQPQVVNGDSLIMNDGSPLKPKVVNGGSPVVNNYSPLKVKLVNGDSPVMNAHSPPEAHLSPKISKIAQAVGLYDLGLLAVLQSVVGHDGAFIRPRALARDLGISYRGLLVQFDRLIAAGYVISPPGDAATGRWTKIAPDGEWLFTTLARSSSSSYLNTTTTKNGTNEPLFIGELAFTNEPVFTGELPFTSEYTFTSASQSFEKIKLKFDAQELFYVALMTKVEAETLSLQTLHLFDRISKEKDRGYALALFLILLPKVKDNPTGYIWSAFKQGAEPNADSLNKIKKMNEVLECLSKNYSPEEAKQQMQSALDKGNTQVLLSLAEQQEKYKKALQLLSWNDTLEALIQKRDDFVTSLLK